MIAKKAFLVAAASAFIGAFLPTLFVLHMMLDNNNNGEFYDTVTGRWHLGYVLACLAIWYVPSFLLIFALAFGLARLGDDSVDGS